MDMDGSDVETLRPRSAGGSGEDTEAKTRGELALKKHHYIHLYVIKCLGWFREKKCVMKKKNELNMAIKKGNKKGENFLPVPKVNIFNKYRVYTGILKLNFKTLSIYLKTLSPQNILREKCKFKRKTSDIH